MKKIGLLVLALVMVLGTLGVGYAAWFDTLYIEGEVETGTVDINIVELSGTWVYKNSDRGDHQAYDLHSNGTIATGPDNPVFENLGYELISWAAADRMPADAGGFLDDKFIARFDNLYPCQDFVIDFLVKYEGTIPVHLKAMITGDPILEALWQLGIDTRNDATRYGMWVDGYWSCPMGDQHEYIGNIDDVQMHQDDYIRAEIIIHLPQTQEGEFSQANLEGLTGDDALLFNIHLFAIQWNEADIFVPPTHN